MDYAKLSLVAKRLIEKNGRTVTLRKLSSTIADNAAPWRGTTGAAVDCSCKACFFNYDEAEETSDNVTRGSKYAYVAALSAVNNSLVPYDLREFESVIDGSETWEIKEVKPLTPGDVTILYRLELKR